MESEEQEVENIERKTKKKKIRKTNKTRAREEESTHTRSMARGKALPAILDEGGIAHAECGGHIVVAPVKEVGAEAPSRVFDDVGDQARDDEGQDEA